jgi:hypothetical protein
MRSNTSAIGTFRLWAIIVIAALLLGVDGGANSQPVPPPQVTPPPSGFEYAAKIICGSVLPSDKQPPILAPGTYYTALNVHKPGNEGVSFVKKFAIALPGEKPGPVSAYFPVSLKGDEALEIDCPDIMSHVRSPR